jgi:hypothetical protein
LHPQSSTIGLWCNGNTTVFGAVVQGSSPCGPTGNLSILGGFFVFSYIRLIIYNSKLLGFS